MDTPSEKEAELRERKANLEEKIEVLVTQCVEKGLEKARYTELEEITEEMRLIVVEESSSLAETRVFKLVQKKFEAYYKNKLP